MGHIPNALGLKARCENQDRFNMDGYSLAVKCQLLPCLQCAWCLFSLPKERGGLGIEQRFCTDSSEALNEGMYCSEALESAGSVRLGARSSWGPRRAELQRWV